MNTASVKPSFFYINNTYRTALVDSVTAWLLAKGLKAEAKEFSTMANEAFDNILLKAIETEDGVLDQTLPGVNSAETIKAE